MSVRAPRQTDYKTAPAGGALNLNVQHIRAAIKEAAEEARGWAPNDLACDTAAYCASEKAARLVCERKLAAARQALKELQEQVTSLREQMRSAAKPSADDKENKIFFENAERILQHGLSYEDTPNAVELPHPSDYL
jgi:uncharacterized protein (DUF2342 family)